MANLKDYTPVYSFPYPLPGDSVQNTYSRIQELAERIEATYTLLGINLSGSTKLMQEGDPAGGALTGTYPNPTLNPSVALPNGITATTQAQSDNSTKVATTAYVDAYVAGSVPDGAIGTAELADGAVTNAKVNNAAAISYSKLNLSNSIVNADISASAAIAYSKLNLTGSILEADLAFSIATQAELDTHAGLTTSVHGISNTANLVYTSDSRLSDARTPTGGAGGVLSGSYPNPGFAVDMATQSELDTHTSATTSVHGISNTANLVYTSDSRLTDARTPTGAAGGDLTGSYPNPTLGAVGTAGTYTKVTTDSKGRVSSGTTLSASDIPTITLSKISDAGTAAGKNIPVTGNASTAQVVYGTDTRLTDTRNPNTHASTHAAAGSDPLTLSTGQISGLGTSATYDVPVSGDASISEVVKGDDTRLTDARTPADNSITPDMFNLTTSPVSAAIGDLYYDTGDAQLRVYDGSMWQPSGVVVVATMPSSVTSPAGSLAYDSSSGLLYMYNGMTSTWDVVGSGGGGASITVSDTAPSTPTGGAMWFDSTTGKTFIYYEDGTSNQWVEVGEVAQLSVGQHGSSHVRGGSDVIDGDRVTIDYVPTTYTRNSSASGAGDVTDLTAHLDGLNTYISALKNVVSVTKTDVFSSTSTTFVDITGLSAIITPKYTNSKILITVNIYVGSSVITYLMSNLVRNSTTLAQPTANTFTSTSGFTLKANDENGIISFQYLDTPSTTSATTYKIQMRASGASTWYVNQRGDLASVAAVSTITLQEIPV